MHDLLLVLRRFMRYTSLRICNILGLSLLFACFVVSISYIKNELSYDTFYSHADRIVRFSFGFPEKPVDVRVFGNPFDEVFQSIPEIDQTVKLLKFETGVLSIEDKQQIINDFYFVSNNFFNVFDIPLLEGDKTDILSVENKMTVSESFAMRNFGTTDVVGKEMKLLSSRRLRHDITYFISGVYKDFPANSHFRSEILFARNPNWNFFQYVYFSLKENADLNTLKAELDKGIAGFFPDEQVKPSTILMPLTDIHLRSNMQREHQVNGNIKYLYLLATSCLLLFVIVFFNLWFTSNIIFLRNHSFYRMLHINGASIRSIFAQESLTALFTGLISIVGGGILVYLGITYWGISAFTNPADYLLLVLVFLVFQTAVALLPVCRKFAFAFLAGNDFLPGRKFTYRNARYMLAGQFCIVIFTGVLSLGIGKQLSLISNIQIGGNLDNIVVFNEQPHYVTGRYDLFKSELLNNPEIYAVCAGMQLPGSSIKDAISVSVEGNPTRQMIPLLVADNDTLTLYDIKFAAGHMPAEISDSYASEMDKALTYMDTGIPAGGDDYYVLNRKAVETLGFKSPEEAIGKRLQIFDSTVGYRNGGIIAAVTEDFMYTNAYEQVEPLIILQRKPWYNSFSIKYDKRREAEALAAIHAVWQRINPDYPCDYEFLHDRYGKLYANENNISRAVSAYSLICLILANLGLIVFMAFMTKARNKEISIRKVNGASVSDILRMLNGDFITYIAAGFMVSVPLSYYVLNKWLQNFAYKIDISWYLFALTGAISLLLVFIVTESRAYKAATTNPAKHLKTD